MLEPNKGTIKLSNSKTYTVYCTPIRKWDSEKKRWNSISDINRGKAFSIVSYKTVFGLNSAEDTEKFEYVVLINGMRPENYSQSGSNNGWGTQSFANDLNGREGRYKLLNILVDNDAPLEEQSKVVAKYVETLMNEEACTKVNLFGISKGGRMVAKSLKYIDHIDLAKKKLNPISYSMPGLGTIFASPETLFKRIDEIPEEIVNTLIKKWLPYLNTLIPHNSQQSEIKKNNIPLFDFLKNLYLRIISGSHMDYDIAENPEGVPEKHRNPKYYDKYFLSFGDDELSAINDIGFTNITTECTEQTLKNALANGNLVALLLYLSSQTIFKGVRSDGMVSLKSAREIEQLSKNVHSLHILNGHHALGDDPDLIRQVLDMTLEKERHPEQNDNSR